MSRRIPIRRLQLRLGERLVEVLREIGMSADRIATRIAKDAMTDGNAG